MALDFQQWSEDSLIGVHCTHGVNRTGYFICRYMIEKMGFEPVEAVAGFQTARGHNIERQNYVNDLQSSCKGQSEGNLNYKFASRGWHQEKRFQSLTLNKRQGEEGKKERSGGKNVALRKAIPAGGNTLLPNHMVPILDPGCKSPIKYNNAEEYGRHNVGYNSREVCKDVESLQRNIQHNTHEYISPLDQLYQSPSGSNIQQYGKGRGYRQGGRSSEVSKPYTVKSAAFSDQVKGSRGGKYEYRRKDLQLQDRVEHKNSDSSNWRDRCVDVNNIGQTVHNGINHSGRGRNQNMLVQSVGEHIGVKRSGFGFRQKRVKKQDRCQNESRNWRERQVDSTGSEPWWSLYKGLIKSGSGTNQDSSVKNKCDPTLLHAYRDSTS